VKGERRHATSINTHMREALVAAGTISYCRAQAKSLVSIFERLQRSLFSYLVFLLLISSGGFLTPCFQLRVKLSGPIQVLGTSPSHLVGGLSLCRKLELSASSQSLAAAATRNRGPDCCCEGI